jgi:ABC-2 type transport system permease protein
MVTLPLFFFVFPTLSVLALTTGTSPAGVKGAVGSAMLIMFVVPLTLPTVIAAYAVIGERDQGTLEPVLTTPIRREELLLGKALATGIPTVTMAYVLFVVFLFVVRIWAIPAAADLVSQPAQILMVALFDPLLAAFSIWVGLAVSARSSDVRVAQQLSALATLPFFGLLSLFTYRVLTPTVGLALAAGVLLALVDVLAYRAVSAMFDRERLLTRYGKG